MARVSILRQQNASFIPDQTASTFPTRHLHVRVQRSLLCVAAPSLLMTYELHFNKIKKVKHGQYHTPVVGCPVTPQYPVRRSDEQCLGDGSFDDRHHTCSCLLHALAAEVFK